MTDELQKIEPMEVQEVSQQTAIMDVIARAASDPNVDIDKMERLFEMQATMEAKAASKAFETDFAIMQPLIPPVRKKGKSHNGDYAKWEDIQGAVMSVVNNGGFNLRFETSTSENAISVTAVLSHKDGHQEKTTFTLPQDTSGKKAPIHAIASAVSYAKRYSASALLNIRTIGEDDDGNAAALPECIDEMQVDYIQELLNKSGKPVDKFLAWKKIKSLDELPAKQFDNIVKQLKKAVDEKEAK